MNSQEFLWVEKYRPTNLDDVILPEETKRIFQQFVDQENIPNLLLTGSAGVGKTTVAKAMLEMLGADYIVVNGSLSGNIDTLRTDIMNFATTVSFISAVTCSRYALAAAFSALKEFFKVFPSVIS